MMLAGTGKDDLRHIAHEEMLRRGLLPDFSPAVIAEAGQITRAAVAAGAGVRDLRSLLWASIDNDDSRDLDQLSVAEPATGGAVKILVAIADVDALVKKDSAIDEHAWTNTTSVYTPRGDLSDASGEAVDRPHVARRGRGTARDRDRDDGRRRRHGDRIGHLPGSGRQSRQACLQLRSPPGSRARRPRRRSSPRCRASTSSCASRIGSRRRCDECATPHGALRLETLEVRAVFDDGVLADLLPDEKNRAKELIEDFMVAANGVTARYLERKGIPVAAPRAARPRSAGTGSWRSPPSRASNCRIAPDAAALDAFLDEAPRGRSRRAFPTSRSPSSSCSARGEYALEIPGQPAEGHFGLAVKDYTHSTAPNRRFPDLVTQRLLKAALAGRPSPYTHDELADAGAPLHRCRRTTPPRWSGRSRKSAAALLLAPRIGARFDAIVTGASDKGTWVRISGPVAEGRVVRGFEGLDVGDRVRVQLDPHRRRARLHRLRRGARDA